MLWTSILAVIGGFILLVWSADRFITGAAALARDLGVSPLIIGLTIVGFGTSVPEILVSGMAAWAGEPGLAIGNAIGSNIANMGLVLGSAALLRPLAVRSQTLRREFPMLFAVMLLALALLWDGRLGRVDGAILLAALVLLMGWLVRQGLRERGYDPMAREYSAEIPSQIPLGRALLLVAVGLGALLISSRLLVWGAVNIAHLLGVSDLVIGLTVVAIGTSLPELAASVLGALRNEPDIAIGNVLGSNMFNLLAVMGLPGLIHPLAVPAEVLRRDFPIMGAFTVALFLMAYGFRGPGRLNRIEGALLLCGFIAYMGLLYYQSVG